METARESTQSALNTPIYDVIISGAGPVGLFLASELALANCSVLLLERAASAQSPVKQLPFGLRGLNSLSVEALYRRGILQELTILKGPQRQRGHFAGMPFQESNIDASLLKFRLPSSTETNLVCEMAELETVLARRAEALGVTIRRGLALSDFQQAEDGVLVQAGDDSFTGKWLVGCDGSRSVVRKVGGFEFAGTDPEFTGYSVLVAIADPEKLSLGRNVTPTGIYLQSQPGYLVIQDFDGGAFHKSGQHVTLEHVQAVLRHVANTDVTISTLHIGTSWTDRARQATTYRNGRVLLAGDAAHIHAPLGGQGLNLGLGDAMNLGWKLAATIQERAPAGLLDSYTTERHPIGAQVLDWARAQVAVMRPGPQARALQTIFRDLLNTRDGATYFAGLMWGLSTHYSLGGGHPLTGYSVPNFELEDGTTVGELMRDGRGMLLDFTGNAALKTFAHNYGDHLKYVSGRAKVSLGLGAALIRPDGIVAWATDGKADTSILHQGAAHWFGVIQESKC
jgi:2-polyprenyl-6-methoxyphenol hydroxylase-like FAD-dependent oxidoreductase